MSWKSHLHSSNLHEGFSTVEDDDDDDVNLQELSWKTRDLDKAAGFACKTDEASATWTFSWPLGWKVLNRFFPPVIDSFFIPSVAHMELFAASLGSSILKVFGVKTCPFLCLTPSSLLEMASSLAVSLSLWCFPSVEEASESERTDFSGCGENHGVFHGPGTPQFQGAAGKKTREILEGQKLVVELMNSK